MPPKSKSKPKPNPTPQPCPHSTLQLEPSAYAPEAGFAWLPPAKRAAATTKSGRIPRSGDETQTAASELATFPGPLVLPWDDLGWDPDADAQSFKSWYGEKHRNRPSAERRTLYVARVPVVEGGVGEMEEWRRPLAHGSTGEGGSASASGELMDSPPAQDFVDYLSAFYHGFPARVFPQRLRFVPWVEEPRPKPKSKTSKKRQQQQEQEQEQAQALQYVGLATADGNTTRIRARPSPDGVFGGQLNLEDILDAAIAMLPKDAYAIVLLVDHDLYEDEEDDFCCGRAYGGSRVSVVSTARYRPELDAKVGIDRAHMWPASHCREYVASLCAEQDIHNATRVVAAAKTSPMRAAVNAAGEIVHSDSPGYLSGLWFSRLVRTVSHELGHCLCLGHCVYYACLMQSTSGMAEDYRIPPYLCPVCMSKISYKAAVELRLGSEESRKLYVKERYAALAELCERWKHIAFFAGYHAWLTARMKDLANEGELVEG